MYEVRWLRGESVDLSDTYEHLSAQESVSLDWRMVVTRYEL